MRLVNSYNSKSECTFCYWLFHDVILNFLEARDAHINLIPGYKMLNPNES